MSGPWWSEAVEGSQVHALVIGVSGYEHRPLGLSSLRSAAHGAARSARWLLDPDGYRPHDTALASIRLLLSPGSSSESSAIETLLAPFPVPPAATSANVAAARAEWKADARASRHTTIAYVAGHGFSVRRNRSFVLCSDADGGVADPFPGSLDLNGLRCGMTGTDAPRTQWYLFDSCRTELDASDGHPEAAVAAEDTDDLGGVSPWIVFSATSDGAPAFERTSADGTVRTLFSEALLTCLPTSVAYPAKKAGQWCVTAESLKAGLRTTISELAGGVDVNQRLTAVGQFDDDLILTETGHPAFPLSVGVDPEIAGPTAMAKLYDELGDPAVDQQLPLPISSRLLPMGHYALDVVQAPGSAYTAHKNIPFDVPFPRRNLWVTYR